MSNVYTQQVAISKEEWRWQLARGL